jgi:NADPH:quinone reductase-like Zn-dependent oxidoreductase
MPTTTTITETMKAVCIHSFGGPEVLRLEEVRTPEPGADEMLVRVYAAGVNPADWKIREGYLGSFPLPAILGRDFSGVIEMTGSEVRGFHAGDAVFGEAAPGSGSYAEYVLVKQSHAAHKPAALDHVQAASLPVASITAWQALFDAADLRAGQKALIHAAAGGVGGFAVQFAKWKGAQVIGTASAESADYVRQLGADEVIDYRIARFEDIVHDVDMVLDTIGGDTQDRSWRVLKQGGILVSTVQPPAQEKAAAHGVRGLMIRQGPRGDQMAEIAELVASGRIQVRIEREFPLSEVQQAQEMSQSGHTHGKIVVLIESHNEPHR